MGAEGCDHPSFSAGHYAQQYRVPEARQAPDRVPIDLPIAPALVLIVVDWLIKLRYNPKRFGNMSKNEFVFRKHQLVVVSNLMKRVEYPSGIKKLTTFPNNFIEEKLTAA